MKTNNKYFDIISSHKIISSDDWKKEWKNMPEFNMNKIETKKIRKITLQFETENDVKKFSELIGIKITEKTKVLFFPKKERKKVDRVYIDE